MLFDLEWIFVIFAKFGSSVLLTNELDMWQMQGGSISGNSRVHADEHLWSEHSDVVSLSEQRAIYITLPILCV